MSNNDAGAEGVEHLQRAAREMVAAARSFLDAIEGVVEDRDALKEVSSTVVGLAATVGDAIGDAVRGGRPAPWVDSAWRTDVHDAAGAEGTAHPSPAAPGDDAASGDDADQTDLVDQTDLIDQTDRVDRTVDRADRSDDLVDESDDETEEWAQPLVDPEQPRRPSRVRRISVD